MRVLKILGIIALVVIVVALGAFTYVKTALPDVGDAPDLTVELTPERIERGKYLANNLMGCMDCHAQRDYTKFTGPVVAGTQGQGGEKWSHAGGFPGEMYAPNITPYALKDWTDGGIFRAITMGVNKDGDALFPIMPYLHYGKLPEEDIYAVIAYLRTIPERQSKFPERELDFPLNMIVNTIPVKNEQKMAAPDPQNKLAYGEYLMTAAACMECHTRQDQGQFVMEEYMGGGFEFPMPNGTVVTSANITPHPEFGIGSWDAERFVNTFHAYRDSSFTPKEVKQGEFNTIMPWTYYARLDADELEAMFTYLQSLKPVGNQVEKFKVASVNN